MTDRIEDQINEDASPFHPGEQRVQSMLGVREKMETVGRRILRPYLLEQHRIFFADLPLLFLGVADSLQRPWASIRWGRPGFALSPDPGHLQVTGTGPPDDPVNEGLRVGAPVGLLGLMFENRRRNRLNGVIAECGPDKRFTLAVGHNFGNCPKYIQERGWAWRDDSGTRPPPAGEEGDRLTPEWIAFLEKADTFFIATSTREIGADQASGHQSAAFGVDISHRGGRPGFVRVIDDRTFEYPDYTGNYMFNTLGNLILNPESGYLFLDFEKGDLIQLQGRTEILWEDGDRARFPGAERVLRFSLARIRTTRRVIPFRWTPPQWSPHHPPTNPYGS